MTVSGPVRRSMTLADPITASEDVLVVYDPSSKYTEGGGWFYWPGTNDRTNFGFTMEYNKKGTNVKGSLFLVRHINEGETYRVKSTYQEPTWPEPLGNYEFLVSVEDNGEPGAGSDKFWIKVLNSMTMPGNASGGAVLLARGKILVPHRAR